LIHLDPDELICIDTNKVEKESLKFLLASLGKGIDAVSFQNLEVIPIKIEVDYAFEDRLFKTQLVDENINGWPKSVVFNSFSNTLSPAGWFWGHSSGKLAIRPRCGSYFTSSHECYVEGDRIQLEYLLHYNITSYRQFLNKYRNFANYPNRRNARPLRLLLIDIVNSSRFSEEFLKNFYEEHIIYSENDITKIKDFNKHAIKEITAVSDFFFHQQKRTR
jgi:hypothetical protein